MDCSDFRRHHVAFVDDTLPGDLVVAAARHVAECPGCARHDTAVRRSLMLARTLSRDAALLECSHDFGARLEARLAAVRAECRAGHASGRAARDAGGAGDWAPSWRELGLAARRTAGVRTRPAAAAAAALLALSAGATAHTAARAADAPATAATAAPFDTPFSPPAPPLAVEQPLFEPGSGRVVTWVTYEAPGAGAVDAGLLVGPAATGVPLWAAAMLAGEAPAALWRGAGPADGPAGPGVPGVRLVSDGR